MTLKIFGTAVPLGVYLLVIFRCVVGLSEELRWRACLRPVLVGWPGDFLPWPLDVAIISQAHIGLVWGERDHRKLRDSWRAQHTRLDGLRLWVKAIVHGAVAIDDVTMVAKGKGSRGVGFCYCCCISGLCCPGPLLACKILLGESLLAGLALPVIVPDSPAINNDPATKLSEH
jgi:hypothetical protein